MKCVPVRHSGCRAESEAYAKFAQLSCLNTVLTREQTANVSWEVFKRMSPSLDSNHHKHEISTAMESELELSTWTNSDERRISSTPHPPAVPIVQSEVLVMGVILKAPAKVTRAASSSESSSRDEPRRVRSDVQIGCVIPDAPCSSRVLPRQVRPDVQAMCSIEDASALAERVASSSPCAARDLNSLDALHLKATLYWILERTPCATELVVVQSH